MSAHKSRHKEEYTDFRQAVLSWVNRWSVGKSSMTDLMMLVDQEQKKLRQAERIIIDRESRMRAAHRKISEMLHYEGLVVIDEDNGFAEIVMDGLSLGPIDGPDIGDADA